ncbi:hypothetical protein MKX63_18530 [Paenibacillus sp. FSL R7-0179]|uniref:VOC family protein n=1 Tax=Paenibacillus sp. FSL R7-0179 TaxID=2921672 RepID=UPI0030FCAB5D
MIQSIVHIALVVNDYDEAIEFVREPQDQSYGKVAVFKDLYGNLWELLELNEDHPIAKRVR